MVHQKPSLRRRFFKSRAKTAYLLRRFQKGHKPPGNPKTPWVAAHGVFGYYYFFWLRFFEILKIFLEIIFAKIPLRISSKKDTQPPPSGSSLKRQRVQNIILEKRLSIYNAIGIQASVINRVVFLLTEIWFYCFSEYQSSLETAKKQAIFIFLKENLVLGNW